jgi:hypothetical protein
VKSPCLAAVLIVALAGCSNLTVKKVPVAKRIAGHDHVDGFRYYLSRPYVVVKKPIEVATTRSLVVVASAPQPTSAHVTYLNGPKRGQTVALAELSVTSPGSPDVRRLTDSEVAALRKTLVDPDVQRTHGTTPPTAPTMPTASTDPNVDTASNNQNRAGGTLGDPDSGNLPIPAITEPSKTNPRKSVTLSGDIDVVFMPDLDEQYAIRSRNFLAKNAFNLTFQNGWQLNDVAANHDSTTVAIAFLNTVDQAVNAAKSLATLNLGALAPFGPLSGALDQETLPGDARTLSYFYLEETTYLKPGVYRLNKPWEMEGPPQAVGCGLLAKLGLTTVTQVKLVPVPKSGP